jgi:TMEM175 potassium channel family protein
VSDTGVGRYPQTAKGSAFCRTRSPAVEASRVGARWETGRTEAFSDGVFAIAITLLVLEINVPEAAFDNLWKGIVDEWPAYLGYATSFMTIGGIWLAHHAVFRRLRYANSRIMRINLLLLMAVAFLPYPTRLVAEAIHDQSAERVAVIFYGLTLLAISLLFGALWGTVTLDRELLKPEVSDEEVNRILLATTPGIGFYAGATAIAIVAPRVAAIGYLVIAVVGVWRAQGDEPAVEQGT